MSPFRDSSMKYIRSLRLTSLLLVASFVLTIWIPNDAVCDSDGLSELLKERADLAAQVKKLRDEVSKRKRMIKEGNFEPDLSPCPPCQLSEKGEESESDAVPFESNILSTLNKIQSRKASSARFLGNYPFKTEKLPSIDANDPKLVEMLQRGRPIIIKNSGLVQRAVDTWDLNYILEQLGGVGMTISDTRQFLYYSYDPSQHHPAFDWTPPFSRSNGVLVDFVDFVEKVELNRNGSHSYYHAELEGMDKGPGLRHDYDNFNWKWLDKIKPDHWGKLVSNLFILGMPNVVTPAHYDGQQNLFTQIRGFKRCIIFPPDNYPNLYLHPHGHPSSRQTQIDFDAPDLSLFPRFRDSEGLEAIVGPGDVLYIPAYWFHHIESEIDSMTLSMNFWFEGANGTEYTIEGISQAAAKKQRGPAMPEEEDEGEEEEAPQETLKRGYHPELPKNTHQLQAIKEIRSIIEIENSIAMLVGPENVKEFLTYGFSSRFDLMKYRQGNNQGRHLPVDGDGPIGSQESEPANTMKKPKDLKPVKKSQKKDVEDL